MVSGLPSLVAGTRPVATRMCDPRTTRPSCNVSSPGLIDEARPPSSTSTPSSSSPSTTSGPTNSSNLGSGRSPDTTSFTFEPSRAHACAISTPTTPPPSTTSDSGTSRADVASREVHTGVSARPSSGGIFGTLPVHTTTAWRARYTSPPTVTSRSPVTSPSPRMTWMFSDSAHLTWPVSSQLEVKPVRRSSTAAASSDPPTTPLTRFAAASACPERSSAFDGMHAQYEHSPPTSSFSIMAVDRPPAAVRQPRSHLRGHHR